MLVYFNKIFINKNYRKSYMLNNTKGRVKNFLKIFFINTNNVQNANKLVNFIITFLINLIK